jgi:hypothetical protein
MLVSTYAVKSAPYSVSWRIPEQYIPAVCGSQTSNPARVTLTKLRTSGNKTREG